MVSKIISSLGSIFAALCCIGTPALLAFLSSIGVGFLINDKILIPLLVVFLGISIGSVYKSSKFHGRKGSLILVIISAIVVFAAIWFSKLLVYIGLVGLIAASVWDIYLQKACKPESCVI
ncbi:MAG TPA: MerC domain-containing protein [Thermodesulfobacteriota bacterium]